METESVLNAAQNALHKRNYERRIYAEDPEWNILSVKKLTDICLKVLVLNFESYPVLDKLPLKYKNKVLSNLPTTLPLQLASNIIPDCDKSDAGDRTESNYWQRRAQENFKRCDVSNHDGSWKQLFFERHAQQLLESFMPPIVTPLSELEAGSKLPPLLVAPKEDQKQLLHDVDTLVQNLKIAAPYVNKLHLTQLRSNEKDADGTHIDMKLIFDNLPHLADLKLYYGVNDCGINFEWKYFGMNLKDCDSLTNCIRSNSSLVKLDIQHNQIDDVKMKLICSALLENKSIEHLDLSHNQIGNSGARGLAQVLASPDCRLISLNLGNNRISEEGVHALSKALSSAFGMNRNLQHLYLPMNQIDDQGGADLFAHLINNTTLNTIDLSANPIGAKTLQALSHLISCNTSNGLEKINLSCNKFAVNSKLPIRTETYGKMISEAISINKNIVLLDLRSSDVPAEFIDAINSICKEYAF